ncbi:MAG: hypothetical protein H5T61_03370 [Thermoflexales bacterium]|nr:hypothetical protein [Thermoflexales bacterium]
MRQPLLPQELRRQTGYPHELAGLPDERMEAYLRSRLAEVPIEQLVAM